MSKFDNLIDKKEENIMAVEINPGVNVIDMIEQGMAKAAEAKANAGTSKDFVGNTIVLLKDGQRAYVRPLYNMNSAIYRLMHDKYKNTDASLKANENGSPASLTQFCGKNPHINQPCKICAKVQAEPDAKHPEAKAEIFVPVYLHKLVQVKVAGGQEIEEIVSYEDKQANTFKPVQGFRLLRCKMGSPVLSQLMKVYRDPDYSKDVTGCVFTID